MMPVGPLMIEHRTIERMVPVIRKEVQRMLSSDTVDAVFIDRVADFFRSFADRCHHGKEEDILFSTLAGKTLSDKHRQTMNDLVEQHVFLRKQVAQLLLHKEAFLRGDSAGFNGAVAVLNGIADFYPKHADTEDHHFFLPVMSYLSIAEQEDMLHRFAEFDRKLFHEKYKTLVEEMERT